MKNDENFEIRHFVENMPNHLNEMALMRILKEENVFPKGTLEDVEIKIPHPFSGAYECRR